MQLLFQGDPHTDFMSIFGRATLSKNQEKIDELWDPILKTWFTDLKEDSRIRVIKVTPQKIIIGIVNMGNLWLSPKFLWEQLLARH